MKLNLPFSVPPKDELKVAFREKVRVPLRHAGYRGIQGVLSVGTKLMPMPEQKVVSGPGSIAKVPSILAVSGSKKTLIVTGPNIGKTLGVRLSSMLREAGQDFEIFSEVEANPSTHTADAIFNLYRETGCDSFVALGGGSPMDAAKGAAARAARPKRSLAGMAGLFRVLKRTPLLIAIPTTAGTGSEATLAAVLTDVEGERKFSVMDPVLIPKYAILDPELLLGLPPHITAATGMDALTHAVESYVSTSRNTKETEALAEDATVTIMRSLIDSYENPSDLELREKILQASYKAGFAFTRVGVGNIHAIAHAVGALYHVSHGLANAVILPIVLEDYGSTVHKKLARLAEKSGICNIGRDEVKARAFIAAIRDMNAHMGLPDSFDTILSEDIERMVKAALAEANPFYPVPVIYDEARCAAVIERMRTPKPTSVEE